MKRHAFLPGLALSLIVTLGASAHAADAAKSDQSLNVYWIDVEGGAATLIVTPAGESLLIDAGNPGERDAGRIARVAKQAGLKKIDHMLVTHFHRDHFGGVADLAALIPIGTLYDNGIASAPEKERTSDDLQPYRSVKVGRRVTLQPGMKLKLGQTRGAARLSIRVIAGRQKVAGAGKARANQATCAKVEKVARDESDNANSAVTLVEFGPFRFFDGGDMTWNVEETLVCPRDRVGTVDVYQSNHHGLDSSNNPVLVGTLAPTVAVFNNGTRKGCEPKAFQTVKAVPSVQAIFQMHKNLREDVENNTTDDFIANHKEDCAGEHIHMSVKPDGTSYTVSIPATGFSREFATRIR